MGVLDYIPVIGDAVDSVGGVVSSFINRHSQKETNKANERINAANNAFNAEQAQLNRDFQSKESEIARNFNASEAEKSRNVQMAFEREMFDKENAWNSPGHQLSMLVNSGINPNLLNPSLSSAAGASQPSASASASAPGGSQASAAGSIGMQSPILSNPDFNFGSNVLALESLKQDVKAKKLANEEKQRDLDSKKKLLPFMHVANDDSGVISYYDDDGFHYEMEIEPPVDYWTEERYKHRGDMAKLRNEVQKQSLEYEILLETASILKKIPSKQYDSLLEDIRQKRANNSLLESDVDMLHKYGISPHDSDGWQTLIKMALRDSSSFDRVLSALVSAFSSTFKGMSNFWSDSADDIFNKLKPYFSKKNAGSW